MEKSSISGTRSILDWICTANTSKTIGNVYRRQHTRWLDGRQKERRRKKPVENQQSITTYFSLIPAGKALSDGVILSGLDSFTWTCTETPSWGRITWLADFIIAENLLYILLK